MSHKAIVGILLVLVLALGPAVGCSTTRTTVTTTTTTESVDAPEGTQRGEGGERQVVVEREVVVEKKVDPSCHGVLSCTFMVAGEAIALPFKVVGAVFSVLF